MRRPLAEETKKTLFSLELEVTRKLTGCGWWKNWRWVKELERSPIHRCNWASIVVLSVVQSGSRILVIVHLGWWLLAIIASRERIFILFLIGIVRTLRRRCCCCPTSSGRRRRHRRPCRRRSRRSILVLVLVVILAFAWFSVSMMFVFVFVSTARMLAAMLSARWMVIVWLSLFPVFLVLLIFLAVFSLSISRSWWLVRLIRLHVVVVVVVSILWSSSVRNIVAIIVLVWHTISFLRHFRFFVVSITVSGAISILCLIRVLCFQSTPIAFLWSVLIVSLSIDSWINASNVETVICSTIERVICLPFERRQRITTETKRSKAGEENSLMFDQSVSIESVEKRRLSSEFIRELFDGYFVCFPFLPIGEVERTMKQETRSKGYRNRFCEWVFPSICTSREKNDCLELLIPSRCSPSPFRINASRQSKRSIHGISDMCNRTCSNTFVLIEAVFSCRMFLPFSNDSISYSMITRQRVSHSHLSIVHVRSWGSEWPPPTQSRSNSDVTKEKKRHFPIECHFSVLRSGGKSTPLNSLSLYSQSRSPFVCRAE